MKSCVNKSINVDSLLLRLPLNADIVGINKLAGINDKLLKVNANTGEIIDRKSTSNDIAINKNGIKYKIWIRKKHIRGITDSYLYVIITSKMLKKQYFEGITMDNISLIYNELIKLNIFYCSFDTFLNLSNCTDIDFKQDKYIDVKEYSSTLKYLREATKETKLSGKGYKNYRNGIQWNTRKKATKANPFVKIYDKDKELVANSEKFKKNYLKDWNTENLKRLEINIKDLKHFKRLGFEYTLSLKNVLSLSKDEKKSIKDSTLKSILNLSKSKKTTETKHKDLSPSDKIVYSAINALINSGNQFEDALEILSTELNKRQRHRFYEKWKNRIELFKADKTEFCFVSNL